MFAQTWLINIMMRYTGGQVLSGLTALERGAGRAALKIDAASAALVKFNRLGTSVAGVFALAGAAVVGFGIVSAAKLQMAMTGTYAVTHASMSQQKALSDQVMQMSDKTAQNAVTIAREQFIAAKSGLGSYSQLHSLFPTLAMAADVMWAGTRGTAAEIDPQQAVQTLAALAHMFGAYQGADMKRTMDMLVRVAFNQPESLQRMQTQSQYFVGQAMAYGVPLQDIADTYSIMGQTGKLRSKGGTGVENLMLRLMGATTTSKNVGFLKSLHLWDNKGIKSEFDPLGPDGKTRHLQLTKVVDFLASERTAWTKQGRGNEFTSDLFKAFNVQAGQYASIVTQKQYHDQTLRNRRVRDQMAAPGQAISHLFDLFVKGTFLGAFSRFATSFANVFTNIFTPMMPELTALFNVLADALSGVNDFLKANPGFALALANIIIALTGLAALRFMVGMSGGLVQLISAIPLIMGNFGALRGTLILLDQTLAGGVGARIVGLAGYIRGLLIAGPAGNSILALSGGIRMLMGTITPFLSLLGVILGTTSFMNRTSGFQDTITGVGGPKYWDYLKKHHVTVDNYSGLRGSGKILSPQDWMNQTYGKGHGGGFGPDVTGKNAPVTVTNHINVSYSQPSTEAQARQVADLINKYTKSIIQSAGDVFTSHDQASVFNHDLSGMTHGYG